jgi:hypothetical protein
MASLRVWPNSQAMELDDLADRLVAIIVNESEELAEPGARMFIPQFGEIVDGQIARIIATTSRRMPTPPEASLGHVHRSDHNRRPREPVSRSATF